MAQKRKTNVQRSLYNLWHGSKNIWDAEQGKRRNSERQVNRERENEDVETEKHFERCDSEKMR